MSGNNVRMSICSRQFFAGLEEERVEQQVEGRLLPRRGGWLLSYREGEAGGAEEILTVLRLEEDGVELQRTGAVNVRMRFRAGEPFQTRYGTAYGVIPMEIRTRRLACRVEDSSGEVEIDYELDLGGHIGRTLFRMSLLPLAPGETT